MFYHKLFSDENRMCHAMMVNPQQRVAFTISYSDRELPYLIHWKCRDAGNYVTGIEPFNCHPEGVKREQENGTLRCLAAHEVVSNDLSIRLCSGDEADSFLK